MKMTSMKLSKKEAKEEVAEMTAPTTPEYPYGLRLCLDGDTMAKLGMTETPKIGAKMMITAQVECVAASAYASKERDDSMSCDLQITDMAIEGAKAPISERLYGGAKS